MSRRPVGLDTNLFIRQAARRMLAACCERTGRSVYLPKQTLREAPRKIMPLYVGAKTAGSTWSAARCGAGR